MTNAPPPPADGGIPGLLAEALRGAGDLVRGEVALFRHEMNANLRGLVVGLAAMVAAAVFAVVGLLVLIDALVKWLATVVGSEALSALIVGVALLALAVIFALVARGRLTASELVPSRTLRQVKRDAAIVTEHVGS